MILKFLTRTEPQIKASFKRNQCEQKRRILQRQCTASDKENLIIPKQDAEHIKTNFSLV